MDNIYESDIEELAIELLQAQGYTYLSLKDQEHERASRSDVVLRGRLEEAIDTLNPDVPTDTRAQVVREVMSLPSQSPIENNETFHGMLTDGVSVEYQKGGETVGDRVKLIDFETPLNNSLLVCNQFTVVGRDSTKRPDIVLFVNGLPLVVMELKNPTDPNATVEKAFNQLQTYKDTIPNLFHYNGVLVASDGLKARAGSLTAGWGRFMAWKTVDGVREDARTTPQLETLIKGMLRPDVLLDLIRQFTVFEKEKELRPSINAARGEEGITQIVTVKKIAAYHQYHAVNEAIKQTIRAKSEGVSGDVEDNPMRYNLPSAAAQAAGDKRIGVIWHTQGSGKSLSMLFYAGKLIVDERMGNPTLVVITDRNDLDDQLFGTFAKNCQLLRQKPVQAESRKRLKELLKTAGGGVVFTTIQKFSPEGEDKEQFELLSERTNIVVIADEAHRSQYGFGARTTIGDERAEVAYGFAKYLRDALPQASFIGFTGTPIESEDVSTPAVFGNYIDVYDIYQAIEDGMAVRIYYESRLAQVHLKEEEKERMDEEVDELTEGMELTASKKAKAKWAQREAIVGHKARLETVAQDLVSHFEQRRAILEGKGMIVTMSRRIAVELYDEIIKLRPDWHSPDKQKGKIKVIMTSSSSDPSNWQPHYTSKQQRSELSDRFKDPNDPLELVIVRDMWLTGFDIPCLHTMYIDKLMKWHNLMQAIARPNRIYKDKEGGLIVDYIGIASNLKQALEVYTSSGGKSAPAFEQSEAIAAMLEKYEIVVDMFAKFDYKRFFSADTKEKLTIILEAEEYILGLEKGKERFMKLVLELTKLFAISVPSDEATQIRAELGFFQAVKARLAKLENGGGEGGQSDAEIETAIKQIVDRAITADEVIDIYAATGIKKPNVAILSDEFLAEVRGMKHKNLALELLKKILNDEIRTRAKKNFIQSKKLSEMLEAAIKKYQNGLLTSVEIIEELIGIAKEIQEADKRGEDLGLSVEEIAFYDVLSDNKSARQVLGDDTLRELARILIEKVKTNTTLDWQLKENARAELRTIVKRTLRKYGYPPDKAKMAARNVVKQAEYYADDWSFQSAAS